LGGVRGMEIPFEAALGGDLSPSGIPQEPKRGTFLPSAVPSYMQAVR